MKKILVLKDNYNSFEQFYLDNLSSKIVDARFYYLSSTPMRKLFTHYGLPFESFWYGEWKRHLAEYEYVIVFDSIHTSNMVRYLRKYFAGRIVFWHWNPLNKEKDLKIFEETKTLCEHWTFNPYDAQKYNMKLNNQFFFFPKEKITQKENKAFFVGTDKGRYAELHNIASKIKEIGFGADFHIVNQDKKDTREFVTHKYMNYDKVLNNINGSKIMVEVVQEGQSGFTARTLEAMFFETKLITNNKQIKNCKFYNKENIFVWGVDPEDDLKQFTQKKFVTIPPSQLYPYSGEGWIENFDKSEEANK